MAMLDEICEWRQEERGEAHHRYFYAYDDVERVVEGKRCFVLGRKGAGKTAIAEHIKSISDRATFVQKLTFRSFPFKRLYGLGDDAFSPDSQYITVWKFVIYCAVCQLMARNSAIAPKLPEAFRTLFSLDLETALSDEIVRLTDPSVNLNIMSFGGGYSHKRTLGENPSTLAERVAALENIVRQNLDSSRYYILFDELDEDFSSPDDAAADAPYLRLVVGLFKAIAEVRNALDSKSVHPVLFLRDDIFQHIRFGDRGKWQDDTVNLIWTKDRLRKLVCYRIGRALGDEAGELPEEKLWLTLFEDRPIRSGRGKQRARSPFDHMVRQTFSRPRDVIVYTRECARVARHRGRDRISLAEITDADVGYSEYLKGELVDEIYPSLPQIDAVLDRLSWFEKATFRHDDFRDFYEENGTGSGGELPRFEQARDVLFNYSIIGRLVNTRPTFCYNSGSTRIRPLGPGDTVCVHRGLHSALRLHR